MKTLLIVLFCGLSYSALADHIVGGNIEVVVIDKTPGRYKVVMKVYYDRFNSSVVFLGKYKKA
jgi:hypothetical protein